MAPGGGAWNNQWTQQTQQKWGQAAQTWGKTGPAATSGAIKPAGSVITPSPKATAQPADNSRIVVSTGGKDMNEVVIRTLVGEYVEHGGNHNRKVYKKIQDAATAASAESVEVFLYYWDSRDGDAFEGWWFGNQLGGTQVWSHVKQSTQNPPVSGWKIPWDGAVRPSITVHTKAQADMLAATAAKAQINAKVLHISEEIAAAEASAQTALEQARIMAGGSDIKDWVDAAGLKQAEELLAPQVAQLTAANQKLMESAKGASGDVAKEIAKLGAKLRITASSVNSELGKLRASKLKAEKQEKQRALEEKDAVMLQEIMPEAVQKTNVAEDAVEKAAITAEMITSGGDDLEEVKQAVDETEKSAREAQTAIGEARIFLNSKLASAKRFESDSIRAAATEELGKLLQQLQTAQTKLTPLKTARQDFIQRAAAKKLVDELITKLTPAEVDVDKAEEATALLLAEDTVTKELITQTDSTVAKASEKIQAALKFIESKKKTMPTSGLVRNELEKMEERAQASVSKLNDLKTKQKEVQEKISMSTLTEEAAEKLQAVQEAVAKVAETETPFLTGLEELPLEETLTAVKASETAATSANTSVSIARMFIATKLVEVKRYTAGPSKDAQSKLTQYQKQLEELIRRLNELKKSTSQRKKGALMRESEGCVVKAEELVAQVAEAAACFQDDSKLTELTADELKQAGADTAAAEAAANSALADARKFITARQIEAKGKDTSEEVSQMLLKYQTRLSTAQTEVSKYKKLAATVEQRLAAKKSIEDATQKVVGAEEKLDKACELIAELEESSPEGMGEKAHQDAVKAAEKAATEAQAALKQVDRYLSSQTRLTAAAKEEIAKLIPRVKEAQTKLEGAQSKMKETSEKLVVQGLLSESEKRVKEAEDAVAKAKESEAPFAEGKEELPAEEATAAFATLDANAQAAHSAVGGTKTFLAMKRLAAKRLEESSAKSTTEALTKLQARLDDATKSLQEVRKGMAARKSSQIKKEMVANVAAVEKKVVEATEATKALESIEASAGFSAEKAKLECEKLSGVEKEAQKMMDAALNFLVEKQKDVKLPEEDSKDLQTRLTTAQSELAKSKKALSEFEQRFVAQKLLAEANQMAADLEAEVEKVRKASAPLLEEGGVSFLAASTVGAITEALRDHIAKSSSSKEAVFKEAGGKDGGKIGKEAFVAYLDKLPEKLGNEDLAYPEDQIDGIFAHIDADKDGEISMADFEAMFSLRYLCVQQISITDGYEIAKSKTVQKLEIDDVVELIGEPKLNDANGVSRAECRAVETGKTGWVTLKGNQGKVFLELFSPYNAFIKTTEKLIEAVWKTCGKTNSFVKTKTTALANTPRGPLADARTELTKIKPRVVDSQKAVEGLKKKLAESQKEYVKKQEAVVEARDRKAAAMLIKVIKDKVDVMDANAQKLADVAKPLVSATGAEIEAVATPLTISAEAEKVSAALSTDCASVREAIAEQNEAVAKAPQGPMREAKQEMAKFQKKLEATERKIGSTAEAIRKACASLATSRLAKASAALRESLQKKSVSVDAFFGELSGGKDVVAIEAFLKCLRNLDSLKFPEEHLKLLAQHIGGDDGIGRRNFEKMVQQFYQCVKSIAITNEFGISKSKNVRMLDLGEVVEVLEGPTSDAKLGITRVKGKALVDGASGWISIKGNQNTPFLKEVSKPCYYCVADVAMDHNFINANADAPVRMLKAEEVIEVMEGPRKEMYQGAHRSKARAAKDGAIGWFTMTTKDGTSNAEQSGKFYVCTAAIAMTDVKDIKACKVLRKLDQKEVAKVIDGPTDPDESGVQRIHCKSLKDGIEGWITIKGNKGTVYAEETTKLYNVTNDVALHKKFETDGAVLVRTLEKGEGIEVLEGPKEEKFEVTRLRGRALSDGKTGWVTLKTSNVKQWSSYYKCVSETELTTTMKAGGDVVRKIEKDELIEALDGAKEDGGAMRIKVRLEKDSAIGWATLKSAEGTVLIQHKAAKADK